MNALILRRGMDDDYYRFMRIIADANGTDLVIDRRFRERRRNDGSHDVERRGKDRRTEPPASWQTEGFIAIGRQDVIADRTGPPAPAPSPPNDSPPLK